MCYRPCHKNRPKGQSSVQGGLQRRREVGEADGGRIGVCFSSGTELPSEVDVEKLGNGKMEQREAGSRLEPDSQNPECGSVRPESESSPGPDPLQISCSAWISDLSRLIPVVLYEMKLIPCLCLTVQTDPFCSGLAECWFVNRKLYPHSFKTCFWSWFPLRRVQTWVWCQHVLSGLQENPGVRRHQRGLAQIDLAASHLCFPTGRRAWAATKHSASDLCPRRWVLRSSQSADRYLSLQSQGSSRTSLRTQTCLF